MKTFKSFLQEIKQNPKLAGIFIACYNTKRVLLGKRGETGIPTEQGVDQWDYFGGKVEEGEDVLKGAEREKSEELRDFFNDHIYYKKELVNQGIRPSASSPGKVYDIFHYVFMVENESDIDGKNFPYNLTPEYKGSTEVTRIAWFDITKLETTYSIFDPLAKELRSGLAKKINKFVLNSPPNNRMP